MHAVVDDAVLQRHYAAALPLYDIDGDADKVDECITLLLDDTETSTLTPASREQRMAKSKLALIASYYVDLVRQPVSVNRTLQTNVISS